MGSENGVDFGRGTSRRGLLQGALGGALGVGAGLIADGMRPALGQTGPAIATRPIPHSGELLPVIGLSSLVNADAILVLERGKVYDIGSHAELVERCDIYRNLWRQQHQHLAPRPSHEVSSFQPAHRA